MKSLPEDIVIDILTRLPVKSILRFRSVSKPWSNLPTTPHFIAAHLRRSSAGNPLLIVHHGRTLGRNLRVSVIDSTFRTLHRDFPLPDTVFDSRLHSPSILGSCNGLLCIKFTANFMLWNPATKQFALLPNFNNLTSPLTRSHGPKAQFICERFGFGSTPEPDYKLVRFASVFHGKQGSADESVWQSLEVKAAVFSWKTWSWRPLARDNSRIPLAYYNNPVAANGNLYWIGESRGRRDFVLEFDLARESFRTIDLPESFERFRIETRINRVRESDAFEAMVMSENGRGVKGMLWESLRRCGCFDGGGDYRGYWNGVRVVLQRRVNGDVLGFCDPADGEDGAVYCVDGIGDRVYGVCGFVESLVSVRGGDE
ncbi:unnamed protein product [Linum tenue]|uniref:F-box domain-containing protein n=1 Tax=Linum tenue TaxID=586396 RepID=A0AAV0Q937_9ROSI|nr:unnamed protein product [Linum tenue]